MIKLLDFKPKFYAINKNCCLDNGQILFALISRTLFSNMQFLYRILEVAGGRNDQISVNYDSYPLYAKILSEHQNARCCREIFKLQEPQDILLRD